MRLLRRFLRDNKTLILSIGFLTIFSFGVAKATPPTSPYTAGATLDPQCTPGSSNCTVSVATTYTFGTGLTNTSGTITLDQTFAPVWTGSHTFQNNSVGTTVTPWVFVANNTAATSGTTQLLSPALTFRANNWQSSANAVNDIMMYTEVHNFGAYLDFAYALNNGTPTNMFQISQYGDALAFGTPNNGSFQVLKSGMLTTSSDGVDLYSSSSASSGSRVRYSPREVFTGEAWNTSGTPASNQIDFGVELRPVSSASPTGALYWSSRISPSGSGPYTDQMSLNTNGTLAVTGGVTATTFNGAALTASGAATAFLNANGTYTTPYTFSTGLTNTSGTITNNLSVGVAGGQSVIGGTGITDALSLIGTTGNGTATSPAIVLKVGNNGGTTAVNILNSGLSVFNNGISTAGTTSDIGSGANFFAVGGTATTATTNAAAIFGTATTVDYRTGFYGSTSSTLAANDSYAGVLVASTPITTATTGTHDVLANMVIDQLGTVTNTGATVNRTASLAVYGPSTNNNNPNYAVSVRSGIIAMGGNSSGGSPGFNAFQLQGQTATFTDLYSAANSTTTNGGSAVTFTGPTFAATNTNVTYTNAATLTIVNAATAGTNMSITNPMAIYVTGGMSALTGGITTNVGNSISSGANFFSRGTNVMTSTTTAAALFGGAGVTDYRTGFYGSFSSTLGIGESYANVIVASAPLTTPASGTNAIAASMVINPIGTVTAGGATLTNTAALYVSGAGSGGTNNYAFWVGSGLSQFGSSSVTTGTTVATFQNAGGSCNVVPSTSGGITCSSDMNLKKNITLLVDNSNWAFNSTIIPVDGSMLSKVLALRPVDYNWKVEQDSDQKHAGFIAQDVQQIFPDLVTTDPVTHYLSLNYSGLMPYTVEAVQEMNANIINIDNLTKTNTWRDALLAWFGDTGNGIKNFFSNTITTKQLCVKDDGGTTCLTRSQVDQLLGGSAYVGTSGGSGTAPVTTGQGSTQSSDTVLPTPDTSSQTTPSGNTQSPATN